jgi:magnesium-transporting ATPase (P-type)
MWKILYDAVFTFFTSPWAPFITKYTAQGRLVRDAFFANVYQYSGIILFSVCLISCLLYYFYFNKRFGSYHLKRTWFKWMIITSLIIGVLTYFVGRSFVSSFIIPTKPMMLWLSFINFFYGIFLFFIFSILCQLVAILVRKLFSYDLSPMGNRTPF